MTEPRWPLSDVVADRAGRAYYLGATICKRGHVEDIMLRPGETGRAGKCPTCGADLLVACPVCSARIRGHRWTRTRDLSIYQQPSFCDECGAAFPWASRQERIYELENLLGQDGIDEADMVVIHDQLQRLMADDIDEKSEKAAWRAIAARAGGALKAAPVQRVLEGVASALIRRELGL